MQYVAMVHPQESFVFHGDSQLIALFTGALVVGRVRHDAVRGTFVPRIVRSTHYRSVLIEPL